MKIVWATDRVTKIEMKSGYSRYNSKYNFADIHIDQNLLDGSSGQDFFILCVSTGWWKRSESIIKECELLNQINFFN